MSLKRWLIGALALMVAALAWYASETMVRAQSLPAACVAFTDDPLAATETLVKAVHLTELRSCVDALRGQLGLAGYAWTDSTITAGSTPARAVHLTELRMALNEVYAAAGHATPTYTDSITAGETQIRAIHIAELRSTARALNLAEAEAPQFSPAAGTYNLEQSVALSTTTSGGVIRYTTDGSTPSSTSSVYSAPIAVNVSTTIRAKTFSTSHLPSSQSAGDFTLQVAAPTFSPPPGTYTGTQQLTITSATPSATLYYSETGGSPTTLYAGPVTLSWGLTYNVSAIGERTGWTSSTIASGTYVVNPFTCATPSASPEAGIYNIGQQVTLSTSEIGVTIRFTLDGSEPTTSSAAYSSALTMNEPTTLKAKAFRPDCTPSSTAAHTYAIRVAKPTVSPEGDTYSSSPFVTGSTSTQGATLRYTLNGNVPTSSSATLGGGISVPLPSTLTVKAFKEGWAPSDDQVHVYVSDVPPPTSSGTVSAATVTESGFTSLSGSAVFNVSGAFLSSASDITAYRAGSVLPISLTSATSFAVGGLVDGFNLVDVYGKDSQGLPFDVPGARIWAGGRSITVTVRNTSNQAISGALVTGLLSDDETVSTAAVSNSQGQAVLNHTPTVSTLIVWATAAGYRDRYLIVPASQTALTINLDRANNDFSQDLLGWANSAGNNAYTEEHSEAFPGWVECPDCVERSSLQIAQPGSRRPSGPDLAKASAMRGQNVIAFSTDYDIVLTSKNALPAQTVTREFRATPGAGRVTFRYRFATAEPQSTSPQNDTFLARLENLDTSTAAIDSQTVFGLSSAGQLDSQGATGWRTLSVDAQQDQSVRLTLTVDNTGDAAYMSLIFGDIIQEQGVLIDEMQLYDRRSRESSTKFDKLTYLSASSHAGYPSTPAHAGNTVVHGTIRILGTPGDSLKELTLEVFEGTTKRATGVLSSQAASALIGPTFPSDPTVGLTITTPTVMFLIPSSELATVSQTTGGQLTLKVVATTTQGRSSPVKEWKTTKLVWYTNTNRYGVRDLDNCTGTAIVIPCGGDSWALPLSVSRSAAVAGVAFGDFSNMNGGFFPNHTSHTDGDDVDVAWRDGSTIHFAVNKATAERLIQLFQSHDATIDFVYVTFDVSQTNDAIEFWDTIRNAQVNGARLIPENVAVDAEANGNSQAAKQDWLIRDRGRIRYRPQHETHFHIRWKR